MPDIASESGIEQGPGIEQEEEAGEVDWQEAKWGGMIFNMAQMGKGNGEFAHNGKKWLLNGKQCIMVPKDQWIHGKEVITQAWTSRSAQEFQRTMDTWNRVQVFMKQHLWIKAAIRIFDFLGYDVIKRS